MGGEVVAFCMFEEFPLFGDHYYFLSFQNRIKRKISYLILHCFFPRFQGLLLLRLQFVQSFLYLQELLSLSYIFLGQFFLEVLPAFLFHCLSGLFGVVSSPSDSVGALKFPLKVHLPLLLDDD